MQRHINKSWDWDHLSKTATHEFIKNHVDQKWNLEIMCSRYEYCSGYKPIPQQIIQRNINKKLNKRTWKSLSSDNNIYLDLIYDNPEKPWDWKNLTKNHRFVNKSRKTIFDLAHKYPDKPWDILSLFKKIPVLLIQQIPGILSKTFQMESLFPYGIVLQESMSDPYFLKNIIGNG